MRRALFLLWGPVRNASEGSVYLDFNQAANFVCLSRARVEQLLRDPKAMFPRPFQPQGIGGRRCFKQEELIAWVERGRAKYRQARY